MGVQGLLQLLKPAQRDCNLSQFRGQTAAVDIMTWLYKGAYSCAYELGLDQQTLGFLSYPLKMLKLVQTYGIKPICVFDGQHLKAKAATENVRSHNKQVNKELAMAHAEEGKEDEARKYFMRSLVLRTKMIDLFMDIIKMIGIEIIVAPYEADSQIAYMVREGIADFAISEDSDLIVYGCPKLVMKLNFNGYCKVFSMEDFKNNQKLNNDSLLSFLQSSTREQFVQICIMGGCEYLPSIQQIGLKVAVKNFIKHKGSLDQVLNALSISKTFKDRVPVGYLSAVKKVQQVFFYQTVYDPRTQRLTSLEPVPEGLEIDQELMGSYIDEDILPLFVNGELKKSTMTKREVYNHVLDFKKLLNDYIDNAISERSFICLDKKFFANNFWQSDRQQNKSLIPDEESKEEQVHQPKGLITVKKSVAVEDLGFCLDEDSDEDNEEYINRIIQGDNLIEGKENQEPFQIKELNLDNKKVQEDLKQLTSICQNTNQPIKVSSQISLVATPKQNINIFARKSSSSQLSDNQDQIKNPFKKFDEVIPILEEQEKEKDKKKSILAEKSKINEYAAESSVKKSNNKKRKRSEISQTSTATKSTGKKGGTAANNQKLDQFFVKNSAKKLKLNA